MSRPDNSDDDVAGLAQPREPEGGDGEQRRSGGEGQGEAAVAVAQDPHESDERDGALADELGEAVAGALVGVGRELGGVLHADGHHRHEAQAQADARRVGPRGGGGEPQGERADRGPAEAGGDEGDAAAGAVGDRREHERPDEPAGEHERTEQSGVVGAEAERGDDLRDPLAHAVEHAHAHEHGGEEREEPAGAQGGAQAGQLEGADLVGRGGVAAAAGPVPVDQEEQHGGDGGRRGERPLERGDARGPGGGHPGGGEGHAGGGADEVGEGDEADGRGPLPLGEPARRQRGPGVEEQRLGDGDRDGPGEGQAVVGAGEGADGRAPGHENPAQADGDEDPPDVDEPRGRQGERQERQHERHGQHPNRESVHAVLACAAERIGA